MGMLSDEDAITAFINNVNDRRWEVAPSMSVDEQTAKAIVEELERLRDLEN